jgi:hypothetical protein
MQDDQAPANQQEEHAASLRHIASHGASFANVVALLSGMAATEGGTAAADAHAEQRLSRLTSFKLVNNVLVADQARLARRADLAPGGKNKCTRFRWH